MVTMDMGQVHRIGYEGDILSCKVCFDPFASFFWYPAFDVFMFFLPLVPSFYVGFVLDSSICLLFIWSIIYDLPPPSFSPQI